MILTITLNPAMDITHRVARLDVGGTNRVSDVTEQPGGKGVNVSRVLHQLGHPTVASGLLAGATGEQLRTGLRGQGIAEDFFDSGSTSGTRRTVTIVSGEAGQATVLNEPGPEAGSVDWLALFRHLSALIATAELVVLTGSLPPAVPADAYGQLAAAAAARAVPVIVDAGGPALLHALTARPDLIKPNSDELAAATGSRDAVAGGRELVRAGAQRVVVSAGADGMTGLDAVAAWHASPPSLTAVNPTGAGDAAVAALAVGLLAGDDWEGLLRRATAWSAAAVMEPHAGLVDAARADAYASSVTTQRLHV